MQRLIRPWTPEDDERIRTFVAKGVSALRASAALKRNKQVVVERARKLGCPFPTLKETRAKWANTPDNIWRG